MKLILVCLFIVFISRPSSCTLINNLDTFEFGVNVGTITFTESGSIGLLEKLKRISVIVPECRELKYVRVDINNPFGPPSVKFDWGSRAVVITYQPLQYSVSQYTISAKTLPLPLCNPGAVQLQPYVVV